MAPGSRSHNWLVLAALWLSASGCGSQPADPATLPSWVASYPGTTPQKAGAAFVLRTQDPVEKVLDFYERQLAQNGVHKEARGGGEYGGFLSAADDSHSRNVMIDIRPDKDMSEVSISVVSKK